MRFGVIFVIYLVVGVLVAAGIIGDEADSFKDLDDAEAIAEMVLAVVLWPLLLVDVSLEIGGGGGSGAGNGGSGGGSGGSGGGGK